MNEIKEQSMANSDHFAHSLYQNVAEFSKQLKLWAAISLYQYGKLSLARAANSVFQFQI